LLILLPVGSLFLPYDSRVDLLFNRLLVFSDYPPGFFFPSFLVISWVSTRRTLLSLRGSEFLRCCVAVPLYPPTTLVTSCTHRAYLLFRLNRSLALNCYNLNLSPQSLSSTRFFFNPRRRLSPLFPAYAVRPFLKDGYLGPLRTKESCPPTKVAVR